MTSIALPIRSAASSSAGAALKAATRFWFGMTVAGQWAFLYYIAAFYGVSTVTGNWQVWSKNKFLFKGYVPGDHMGNVAFAAHAMFAAVMALGGTLQLVPQIRTRAPWFHRWNGRLFLLTSYGIAFSGFYMNWIRGARSSVAEALGTSSNGVLIVIFATQAWRTAVARDMVAHRPWALRTYIVANGQWFVRIGYISWMILSKGQDHGFYRIWNWASFLFPLAVLEVYLRMKDRGTAAGRYALAGALIVLTLLMGFGIFGFTAFAWTKVLSKL